jgi:transcriptional regulator with XRE-family HTH domain
MWLNRRSTFVGEHQLREKLGFSIKEVAGKLKVPQYRLKAIDNPKESEILPDILLKYVKFLGIELWFEKWKDANSELAKKLAAE